jgi:hypothetical protein
VNETRSTVIGKNLKPGPLDGTEWPLALSFVAYGVRFAVRANDASLAEEVASHLPPGSQSGDFSDADRVYSLMVGEDDGSGGKRYSVYLDQAPLIRSPTLQAALRAFETDIQLHVAEMAPDRVFVHAGVVGCRGRAILLPGRSFTGKSTLVAELIKGGADYYSDEYAVLDPDGGVHPYARPLSIRQGWGPGVTKHKVEAFGARSGVGPLPVGLIVVSQYRPGVQWRPQPLSPGQGVLALLANTIPARRIPDLVMATLHRIVATAPVVAGERGEASEIVNSILELAVNS